MEASPPIDLSTVARDRTKVDSANRRQCKETVCTSYVDRPCLGRASSLLHKSFYYSIQLVLFPSSRSFFSKAS